MKKALVVIGTALFGIALIAAVAGFFYWRHLQDSPEYSLALLIDAAHNGPESAFDELIDTDAVVEDFVPQVTIKAGEIYGRGLPPTVIAELANVAAPIMPIIKERARDELPHLLRQQSGRFDSVPFPLMVVGAGRYLDIDVNGTEALVRSRLPEHDFEVRMQRNGSRWKIIGMRDDDLATRIAQTVGQQLIGAAASTDLRKAGEEIGVKNLESLVKKAETIFE